MHKEDLVDIHTTGIVSSKTYERNKRPNEKLKRLVFSPPRDQSQCLAYLLLDLNFLFISLLYCGS